jgi:hypothetical protein
MGMSDSDRGIPPHCRHPSETRGCVWWRLNYGTLRSINHLVAQTISSVNPLLLLASPSSSPPLPSPIQSTMYIDPGIQERRAERDDRANSHLTSNIVLIYLPDTYKKAALPSVSVSTHSHLLRGSTHTQLVNSQHLHTHSWSHPSSYRSLLYR